MDNRGEYKCIQTLKDHRICEGAMVKVRPHPIHDWIYIDSDSCKELVMCSEVFKYCFAPVGNGGNYA